MPRHHLAAAQHAAVAGRDRLDVVFVEHVGDAAPDRVGRRALQPPVARVQHERSQLALGRGVVVVGDDPGSVRTVAPDMGEQVRAEQRPRRTVVEPARGDQPDRRLHDVDLPVLFPEPDRVRAGHRGDRHRIQDAAAVRLGAEIEPQRRVGVAGVALLDVEVPGEGFHVVDRHELVQPQREQRQRQAGRDQRFDLARGSPARPCRSRCRSAWRRRSASAGSCSPPKIRARWPDRS